MEFLIRRAVAEDAAAIIEVHVRSIQEVCAKDYTPKEIHAWGGRDFRVETRRVVIERDLVWVVELNEKVMGFGHLQILENDIAELIGLYFLPELLGLGAGKQMMEEIKRVAKEKGMKKIKLHSTITAKTFYEAQGFKQVEGDYFATMQGVKIPCFPMELKL